MNTQTPPTPDNDFLVVVPTQHQSMAPKATATQQQQPTQCVAKQQQQQQQQEDYWAFETEFASDVCHGGEIPQHRLNPDMRDFLPGRKSASAT